MTTTVVARRRQKHSTSNFNSNFYLDATVATLNIKLKSTDRQTDRQTVVGGLATNNTPTMSEEKTNEEPKAEEPTVEETPKVEEPKAEEAAAAGGDDEEKVKEEESTATFEPVVSTSSLLSVAYAVCSV